MAAATSPARATTAISRIDPATGQSLGPFVLGGSGGLFSPRSLAFGPDQDLYVSSATGEVLRYDGATGDFLGVFVDTGGNGGGPVDPYGLAFHAGEALRRFVLPERGEGLQRDDGRLPLDLRRERRRRPERTDGAGLRPRAATSTSRASATTRSAATRRDGRLRLGFRRRRQRRPGRSLRPRLPRELAPDPGPRALVPRLRRARRRPRSRGARPLSPPPTEPRVSRRGVGVGRGARPRRARGGRVVDAPARGAARRRARHAAAARPARRDALPRRGERRDRGLEAREEDHHARGSRWEPRRFPSRIPPAPDHQPDESARALDGLALAGLAARATSSRRSSSSRRRSPRTPTIACRAPTTGGCCLLATDYDAARAPPRARRRARPGRSAGLARSAVPLRAHPAPRPELGGARAGRGAGGRPPHHPGRARPVSDRRRGLGALTRRSGSPRPQGSERDEGRLHQSVNA